MPVHYREYAAPDADAVQAIYADYNAARPIAVRRTPAYWRDWLGWTGPRHPGDVLVAEDQGRVVAYAVYTVENSRLMLREIGAYSFAAEALRDLFGACIDAGRAKGANAVEVRAPAEPVLQAAGRDALEKWEYCLRETSMVRLVDPRSMLCALLPELPERWRAAGQPEGRLSFATPEGTIAIAAGANGVRVEEGGDGEFSQLGLFRLVTGMGPGPTAGPLGDIFPERAPAWYWDLDGF